MLAVNSSTVARVSMRVQRSILDDLIKQFSEWLGDDGRVTGFARQQIGVSAKLRRFVMSVYYTKGDNIIIC